jgi:hypothetical protein
MSHEKVISLNSYRRKVKQLPAHKELRALYADITQCLAMINYHLMAFPTTEAIRSYRGLRTIKTMYDSVNGITIHRKDIGEAFNYFNAMYVLIKKRIEFMGLELNRQKTQLKNRYFIRCTQAQGAAYKLLKINPTDAAIIL